MDPKCVRQRSKHGAALPRSSSLQLKYERERSQLQSQLTQQLVTDVLGLYDQSLYVDLKLEASRGTIYCHQVFVAARVPALWHLLKNIGRLQRKQAQRKRAQEAEQQYKNHQLIPNHLPEETRGDQLFTVHLPYLQSQHLHAFVKSLYTDEFQRGSSGTIRRQLEDFLAILQHQALVCDKGVQLEQLSVGEEVAVQRLILQQISNGQLSQHHCTDIDTFIQTRQHSSLAQDEAEQLVNLVVSHNTEPWRDTQRNTARSAPSTRPKHRVAGTQVRKSSRSRSRERPERKESTTWNAKNKMNFTNVPQEKCESNKFGLQYKSGIVKSVHNEESAGYQNGNNSEIFVGSNVNGCRGRDVRYQGRSYPTNPTNRISISEDQESPVYNVSIVKELITSPMQVSGSSLHEKLKDKREDSPDTSSSKPYYTPVEALSSAGSNTLEAALEYHNGATKPREERENKEARRESQDMLSERVISRDRGREADGPADVRDRVREFEAKGRQTNIKPHTYGAMSSTNENASLHMSESSSYPNSVTATAAAAASYTSQLSQDSCSGENDNNISSSGSDHRLSFLHETSSMEVEIPSSHDDYSSHESEHDSKSPISQLASLAENDDMIGLRPIVRTRTFEVIDPITKDPNSVKASSSEAPTNQGYSLNQLSNETSYKGPQCNDSLSKQISISERKVSNIEHQEEQPMSLGFESHNLGNIPSNTSETSSIPIPGKIVHNPSMGSGMVAGKPIADVSSCSAPMSTVMLSEAISYDDPESLRELERKKGSLIFENNFQTYSNIPMSGSMMTASISSDSSMGVGSLYSSMMDSSAMLSSIHSLGNQEPVVAPIMEAAPMPRPASAAALSMVGEPVVGGLSGGDGMVLAPSRVGTQKSLEEMAAEVEQQILLRGPGTRSPSPDSLSVDSPKRGLGSPKRGVGSPKRVPTESPKRLLKHTDSKSKLINGEGSSQNIMTDSASKIQKEEYDDEEKEKDDRESECKSSDSNSNPSIDPESRSQQSHSVGVADIGRSSPFSLNSSAVSSPRQGRKSENIPILSGGSTLKRGQDSSDSLTQATSTAAMYGRQISSVKDVDAIPLAFGYVGPQEKDEKQEETKDDGTSGDPDDKTQNNIFSMFIDLNEIPSPTKEPVKEEKKEPKAKTGCYMYIEADTPSPKQRRKRRSESDGLEMSKQQDLARQQEAQDEREHRSLPPLSVAETIDERNSSRKTSTEKSYNTFSRGSKKAADDKPQVEVNIKKTSHDQLQTEATRRNNIDCIENSIDNLNLNNVDVNENRESIKSQGKSSSRKNSIDNRPPLPEASSKKTSVGDSKPPIAETSSRKHSIDFSSNKKLSLVRSPLTRSRNSSVADDTMTDTDEDKDKDKDKGKKGFFAFIEVENPSKTGSPKSKRRGPPPQKKRNETSTVMTRSAPSDSILYSNLESASNIMTKSVIGREEFIAQPPTRRNVSLKDNMNETSTTIKEGFVTGIPRPIYPMKNPRTANLRSTRKSPHRRERSQGRDSSATRKEETSEAAVEMATSRDISTSELGPSKSLSFTDIMTSSLPAETEEPSDTSDASSLLSSIDRSNDPSSDQNGSEYSRLGEDLLRMFVNEISTDVTIQIGEKKIRAHKCILASRCVYFAAMLSGHWVESAGNVIKLQGFSHECVVVALKHIYSGTSTVPEGVRVGELAALADMLALDGLKDVIALHLKANCCHYFHKPCAGCLEGVLDVLPIAGAYCLDELYHRCLRWVAKHFNVVTPTRNFAALPPEVQDRCLKQLMDDMSVSSVVDTALGCERVLSSLPMVRWAQPVFDLTAQLLEAATSFMAANLSGVLASDRFLTLGKDSGWTIESLEETLRVACELIRPDQAVLSHLQLTKLLDDAQEDESLYCETFMSFVEKIMNQVERFMIHNANRVAVCRKWPLLSSSTQRRIKDAAQVVVEFNRPTAPRPRLSSASRDRRVRGSSSDGSSGMRDTQKLYRSASATTVPQKSTFRDNRKLMTSSQQESVGRCQTPPGRLNARPLANTPPPTRASTLRAQARQAAIQRSQSARSVADRPRRLRPPGTDTSTDEDNTQSSGRRASTTVGGFTRGATFTRSLSRTDQIVGNFQVGGAGHSIYSSTESVATSTSSCVSVVERCDNSLLPVKTPPGRSGRTSTTSRVGASHPPSVSRPRTPAGGSDSGNKKPSAPTGRTPLLRTASYTTSSASEEEQSTSAKASAATPPDLPVTPQHHEEQPHDKVTRCATTDSVLRGSNPSTPSTSRVKPAAGSGRRSVGGSSFDASAHSPRSTDSGGPQTPRSPKSTTAQPRRQSDLRNGNVLSRSRTTSAVGRRSGGTSTRSPLRGQSRVTSGSPQSPASSVSSRGGGSATGAPLTDQRSRSSSVTSRSVGSSATPPTIGSRSSTFCKDDNKSEKSET